MILDVGCGAKPIGDVNTDLYIGHTLQGGDQREKGIYIDPKKIPNFVRCDAQHLPFKSNAFEKVYSSHVLEHIPRHEKMLKEMVRVSKKEVEILCPHEHGSAAKMPHHLNYFNEKWFSDNLPKIGLVEIDVSTRGMDYYHEMFLTLLLMKLHIVPKRSTLGGYHPLVLLLRRLRKVWKNMPEGFESKFAFHVALLSVPYEIAAKGFKRGDDCK